MWSLSSVIIKSTKWKPPLIQITIHLFLRTRWNPQFGHLLGKLWSRLVHSYNVRPSWSTAWNRSTNAGAGAQRLNFLEQKLTCITRGAPWAVATIYGLQGLARVHPFVVYSVLFGCYHQLDESYFHISISAACEESVPKGAWKMEKEIKAENKPSEHLLPFGAI